jgi:Protein of unknown function (DUF2934)
MRGWHETDIAGPVGVLVGGYVFAIRSERICHEVQVNLAYGSAISVSRTECEMENPTKEQVIHRAYELWEEAGKPDGRDQEFYH